MFERSKEAQKDMDVIASYLGYNGENEGVLSGVEMWEIYCLGDGFGRLDPDTLAEINDGWDWSHIRDSSDGAIHEMKAKLDEIIASKTMKP